MGRKILIIDTANTDRPVGMFTVQVEVERIPMDNTRR